MVGLPFYRLTFLMPSPRLELRTLASYTVILHDKLQRESYQPHGPATSVTWFQVLRKQTNPVWLQEHTYLGAHDYAHSSSLYGVSLWSLTLPAAWAGESAELTLLYALSSWGCDLPERFWSTKSPVFFYIAIPTARDVFAWQWFTERALLLMLHMNRWRHCSVHEMHWTSSCTGTILLKQFHPYPPRHVTVTVPHCIFVLAILKLQRIIFLVPLASPVHLFWLLNNRRSKLHCAFTNHLRVMQMQILSAKEQPGPSIEK